MELTAAKQETRRTVAQPPFSLFAGAHGTLPPPSNSLLQVPSGPQYSLWSPSPFAGDFTDALRQGLGQRAEPSPVPSESPVEPSKAVEEPEEELFGTNEKALHYLADQLGEDPKDIMSLAEDHKGLQNLHYMSESLIDEDLDHFARQVAGARQAAKRTSTPGSGSRSSSAWATNQIRGSAKSIVDASAKTDAARLFPGKAYTIHHKISRNKLIGLWGRMSQDPAGSSPVMGVLNGIASDVGTTSAYKALLNMPGALEVGPPADKREGDPGTGFDPNVKDGTMTPRSKHLSEADSMIGSNQLDWKKLAKKLQAVHDLHKKGNTSRTLLSTPIASQWKPAKKNKFVRDKE